MSELYHYGVKGMKWGRRKDPESKHSPGDRKVIDYGPFGIPNSVSTDSLKGTNSRILGGKNYAGYLKNKYNRTASRKEKMDRVRSGFSKLFTGIRRHQVTKGKLYVKQKIQTVRFNNLKSIIKN